MGLPPAAVRRPGTAPGPSIGYVSEHGYVSDADPARMHFAVGRIRRCWLGWRCHGIQAARRQGPPTGAVRGEGGGQPHG